MTGQNCLLCGAWDAEELAALPPRRYFRCGTCALTFLDPALFPSPDEERAEYDLHENDPADLRYRKWLSKLIDPLVEGFPRGARGLDYGCGPGPAVSVMLRERGFDVANFDPFYVPDRTVLDASYEFISCTETAEHFHNPAQEFARLVTLLAPGGRLGVMTQMLLPDIDFATWRYRLQPSHVVFYTPDSMEWIATHFDLALDLRLADVALFQRRDDAVGLSA